MNKYGRDLITLIRAFPPLVWVMTDTDGGFISVEEAYANNQPLPIWGGSWEGSIWGSKELNALFRAYHDSVHMLYGCDFSLEGELKASVIQADHAHSIGLDELAQVLVIETAGQALYYDTNGKFPPQTYTLHKLLELGVIT